MRTQVGIVGAGPAGLFLSLLLQRAGIDCVVLEAKSREYVESRVRAGVLEQGTVDLMAELGADARLRRESMIDAALDIRFSGKLIHLDLPGLSGGKLVHHLRPAGGGERPDRGKSRARRADPVRGGGGRSRRAHRRPAGDPFQA